MLLSLSNTYYVKSNKESGYGRYAHIKECDSTTLNLMIIPKDNSKLGVIIEFKKISDFSNDTVEEATEEALKQIKDMKYRAELEERNINNILELAIVFKGKVVKITKK